MLADGLTKGGVGREILHKASNEGQFKCVDPTKSYKGPIFGKYDPVFADRNAPFAHWRQRLTNFFMEHDKKRVDEIDWMLVVFRNKEESMMKDLHMKYKQKEDDVRQVVTKFFMRRSRKRVPEIDDMMNKFRGRYRQMIIDLELEFDDVIDERVDRSSTSLDAVGTRAIPSKKPRLSQPKIEYDAVLDESVKRTSPRSLDAVGTRSETKPKIVTKKEVHDIPSAPPWRTSGQSKISAEVEYIPDEHEWHRRGAQPRKRQRQSRMQSSHRLSTEAREFQDGEAPWRN